MLAKGLLYRFKQQMNLFLCVLAIDFIINGAFTLIFLSFFPVQLDAMRNSQQVQDWQKQNPNAPNLVDMLRRRARLKTGIEIGFNCVYYFLGVVVCLRPAYRHFERFIGISFIGLLGQLFGFLALGILPPLLVGRLTILMRIVSCIFAVHLKGIFLSIPVEPQNAASEGAASDVEAPPEGGTPTAASQQEERAR
ncbi:unnamed protein product [Vitrella brassicaformis CCMP3155]|uniref:Uncharacterized protein n=2 Tax=Vitrella brassicaformis TaxID=1169539 RepID=A0A0G4G349_VITBC|nr:unnamed protein product [Vitrella brassicaformis CCMP3155]|eukprot:CEM22674.1 unnamed protein product [Vitrella brassicaformis CCMP3155]